MSLIPTQILPKQTQLAIQTEESVEGLLIQLANNLSGSIQECWSGDGYAPQKYIAAYGTNAVAVFSFHGELIGLLRKHAAILPASAQVPDAVLALVGNFVANQDGTITTA